MVMVRAEVDCPVVDSFRVQQVGGMFDVPIAERARASFEADVPSMDEPWTMGLIVGPSGSGKSTIARRAFADHLAGAVDWPADRAVVDCFGDLDTRQIAGLFTAVGFGSPPSWIKPYRVLSGGEQFRCNLARALAVGLQRSRQSADDALPVVVFDEFSSVVDRNVARIGSAAIARSIRGGAIGCRFVAVTCHYDVAEWLEPDWVVDMADRSCTRRRLRRPEIHIELRRVRPRLWASFAPHHYLNGSLNRAARCYAGWWQGNAVSFCATLPMIGRKHSWRISRLVTLPDYQGVGIGTRVAEAVCDVHMQQGHRIHLTASHPALLAHCRRSSRWRTVRVMKSGSGRAATYFRHYRSSTGRCMVSFEYLGQR